MFVFLSLFRYFQDMPVENLEEEGLPKNPNLDLAQWRYILAAAHGENKEEVAKKLFEAIKENGEYWVVLTIIKHDLL